MPTKANTMSEIAIKVKDSRVLKRLALHQTDRDFRHPVESR